MPELSLGLSGSVACVLCCSTLALSVGCSAKHTSTSKPSPPGESVWSSPDSFPEFLAADSDSLFWVDATGGQVLRADAASGKTTVIGPASMLAVSLALDASDVYWIDQEPGRLDSFMIRRAPKGGGDTGELARFATTDQRALSNPVESEDAYNYFSGWNDLGLLSVGDAYVYAVGPSGDGSVIAQVDKASGAQTVLWTDGGPFEWVRDMLAVDGSLVVAGQFSVEGQTNTQPEVRRYAPDGRMDRAPLDHGGSPISALELAAEGGIVYLLGTVGFADSTQWGIWQVNAAVTYVAPAHEFARDLAAAGGRVFYIDVHDDIVSLDPVTKASTIVVQASQFSSVRDGLAANGTSIYWAIINGIQKQAL